MSGVYDPVIGVKNALDDILDKVKSSFEKLFPAAVPLTWQVHSKSNLVVNSPF